MNFKQGWMLLRGVGLSMIVNVTVVGLSRAQDPSAAPPRPLAEEVLTRGPVHEAFAGPVVFDPKPNSVVPKTPPDPVEEVPPDQKPSGSNVEWISGYWAWDDGRTDFIWLSGVWRDVPPGQQWVPGYWAAVGGGSQWVPGMWAATNADSGQYLPEPPASLEQGPSSPTPDPGSIWAPGSWVWQNDRYAWQPGYWVTAQPNWMWMPSRYSYTPNGYLYNAGYWDRPFDQRGQLFAPVYFSQPIYRQAGYAYRPTIGLVATSLLSSLFIRPSYGNYYFGDYYDPNYASSGIIPWSSFGANNRTGYDPLYHYYASTSRSANPNWATQIRQSYEFRRDHAEARPAQSFAAQARQKNAIANEPIHQVNNNGSNLVFARPFSQITSAQGGVTGEQVKYLPIDATEQARIKEQSRQLAHYRQNRLSQEAKGKGAANAANPAPRAAPRPAALARSPIVAGAGTPAANAPAQTNTSSPPPALPNRPAVDPNAVQTPRPQIPRENRPPAVNPNMPRPAGVPKASVPRPAEVPKAATPGPGQVPEANPPVPEPRVPKPATPSPSRPAAPAPERKPK